MRRWWLAILSITIMFVVVTVGAIGIGGSGGRVFGADENAVKPLLIAQQAPSADGDSSSVDQTPSSDAVASKYDSKINYRVYSPNAFKVQYLGVDGTFTIDPTEVSATDPRNPKRVVFNKMEFFSFYDDLEGKTPIAENCRYVYKGAAGDPFYYPKQSKRLLT